MKILKSIFKPIINFKIYVLIVILYSFQLSANQNNFEFEISGNKNTDREVIISIIDNIPDNINDEFSNYLLKELNNTGLFQKIKIKFENNMDFDKELKYLETILENNKNPILEKLSILDLSATNSPADIVGT